MKSVFIFIALFSVNAFAGLCDWPVPNITIHESQLSGISRAEYDKMLDLVQLKYDPVFKNLRMSLKLHRSWSDGTVNAQAWFTGSTCNVEIFGGLARFPGITSAGVRQAALHEIGHCLGGAPYYTGEDMSVEGQADYYSTAVGCNSVMKVGCKASSLNLASALARMSQEPKPWRPGPQLPEVGKTYEEHPEAQCRLDTYDAGILKASRPRCWFKP